MRAKWSWWKTSILLTVGLAALFWVALPLDAFQDCIHQRKDYQRYQPLHEKEFSFVRLRLRLRLNAVCFVHLAVPFNGILVALSGVAVAAFTATLWVVTRRSVYVAELSAKTAERALTELERPLVFVSLKPGIFGSPNLISRNFEVYVSFDFANYGRFPAIIKECRIGISIDATRPSIPPIRDQWHGTIGPNRVWEDCKEWFPLSGHKFKTIIANDFEWSLPQIKLDEETLFFYVIISYTGVGTAIYDSVFCWRFDYSESRWGKLDDARYNYQT